MITSAESKGRPPSSSCTGAPVEMVCAGGEVSFVGRLLAQSIELQERIGWYSAMLGKLSSLEVLVTRLRENHIDNYAVTKLSPGRGTRRWVLAWSFRPYRPSEEVARGLGSDPVNKKLLPRVVNAFLRDVPLHQDLGPLISRLREILEALPLISWEWNQRELAGTGRAHQNVWSRSARRQTAREISEGNNSASSSGPPAESKFGFRIFFHTQLSQKRTELYVRWLEGHDSSLFETFQGFLRSQLKEGT
jgi:23S rRNA (adenine1618-N6)-methyltransferase